MRTIYQQVAGLAGIVVFMNEMWRFAPLEQTLFSGFAAGIAVYLVLFFGEFIIRRILEMTPPRFAEEGAGTPSPQEGRDATSPTKP